MSKLDVKSSVTIDKEKIQRSLTSMNLIFRKSNPNQESNVFIKSEDGSKLQILANQSGVFIRTISEADSISGLNQWCLDGAMLSKFIGTMNKGKITIQSDDTNIYAKQGRTTLKIPLKEVSNPSTVYNFDEMDRLTLDTKDLLIAMKKAIHACATNSHNPGMLGVLINYFDDNSFDVVSTDSKRMAFTSINTNRGSERKLLYQAIIPRTSADEMIKIFDKTLFFSVYMVKLTEKEVEYERIEGGVPTVSTVGFVSSDTEFYTQTIHSNFPEHKAIIDQGIKGQTRLVLNREDFLEKVRQVNTCSDKIALSFGVEGIQIKSVQGLHDSEITVFIDQQIENPPSFRLGILCKYIIEALVSISSRLVELRINSHESPFMVSEHYSDTPDLVKYGVIMMPFTLDDQRTEKSEE